MKQKKGIFSFCLCILLVLFLVFSPTMIISGVHKNIYSLKEQKKEEQYRGEIVLWHVVSFKTGGVSGVSFLKERAKRFERQNPYVFIEVKGLTVEEAKEKLKKGERPDLISYPFGLIEENSLMPLEEQNEIAPAYQRASGNRAYPYMADSYVLVANKTLLAQSEVEQIFGEEISKEWLYTALGTDYGNGKGAVAFSSIEGIFPRRALEYLCLPEGKTEESISATTQFQYEDFLEGNVAMYICPNSEYRAITRDSKGQALSLSAYVISYYTDLIQLMGAFPCEDDKKAETLQRFLSSMLQTSVQKQIPRMDMLPTTYQEDIVFEDMAREKAYFVLMEEGIVLKKSNK